MFNLRRSLLINFVTNSGMTVVQFVVSIILARILSPREIGVFSMTLVFVNIVHIFRDFGVSSYLQREPNLTHEKIRSATGVMFATSWLLALVLFASSNKLAAWFGEPLVADVLKVLAAGFLFNPLGSVTNALLSREFAADKQAYAAVAGTLSYSLTCLGLALLGFGTMSLAWGNLVNVLVSALALVPFRPKGLPWIPSFKNWGGIVNFGTGSLLSSCATAVNNALPDMLLGRLAGATKVGLFSRANSTVSIFLYIAGSTVNYGSTSYISQTYHRGEPLTPILNKAVGLLTGIAWPILAVTTVFGKDIVLTLYGPKWLDCVPAITGLAASAAISLMFNYTPTALLALGRPYQSAIPTLLTVGTRILFVFLLFNGDLSQVSWLLCAATLVSAPVMLYQQHKYLGYKASSMIATVMRSFIVALVCFAVAICMNAVIGDNVASFYKLCIVALPLIAAWYIALRMTNHYAIIEIDNLMQKLASKFSYGYR